MKLAEALANRADLQRRIEQMRGRIQKSALVQEGESAPEDPQELLGEAERLVSELEGYVRSITGRTFPRRSRMVRRRSRTPWRVATP